MRKGYKGMATNVTCLKQDTLNGKAIVYLEKWWCNSILSSSVIITTLGKNIP